MSLTQRLLRVEDLVVALKQRLIEKGIVSEEEIPDLLRAVNERRAEDRGRPQDLDQR